LQADQVGRDSDHVRQVEEGLVDQGHALVEDLFGAGHKRFEPLYVGRAALLDLAQHQFNICTEIEGPVAVIEDTVEGVAGNQLKVVLTAASGRVPDFVEDPGRGDHRGTGIEGETVDFVDIGAAAQLVALFEQLDLVTAGCQPRGGAQTAKPGTDYDNSRQ